MGAEQHKSVGENTKSGFRNHEREAALGGARRLKIGSYRSDYRLIMRYLGFWVFVRLHMALVNQPRCLVNLVIYEMHPGPNVNASFITEWFD